MFILANFFLAAAKLLSMVLTILMYLIFFRAIISWVSPDPYNPIVQFLHKTTEPILMPIRRFLPMSGIDFSPLIAFALIIFLQTFLVASLKDLSYHIRSNQSIKVIEKFDTAPAAQGDNFFK